MVKSAVKPWPVWAILEALYPGHDWESGAVGSWIVGVKLGKALICGGNVGMIRVKVWAVNCQVK